MPLRLPGRATGKVAAVAIPPIMTPANGFP